MEESGENEKKYLKGQTNSLLVFITKSDPDKMDTGRREKNLKCKKKILKKIVKNLWVGRRTGRMRGIEMEVQEK